MTDTTISNSKMYVYVTDGTLSSNTITTTGDQKVVKIAVDKIDESIMNDLMTIPIPVSRGNWTTNPATTYLIDLKRLTRTSVIHGYLNTESGGDSKETKRTNLRILAGAGSSVLRAGTVTVVWGVDGTDRVALTCVIQKLRIIDYGNLDKFEVQMTVIEGVNR